MSEQRLKIILTISQTLIIASTKQGIVSKKSSTSVWQTEHRQWKVDVIAENHSLTIPNLWPLFSCNQGRIFWLTPWIPVLFPRAMIYKSEYENLTVDRRGIYAYPRSLSIRIMLRARESDVQLIRMQAGVDCVLQMSKSCICFPQTCIIHLCHKGMPQIICNEGSSKTKHLWLKRTQICG